MKKFIIAFIAFLTIFCSLHASAADTSGILKIVVDKKPVTYTDAYPYVENGRTMIPLRLVSENMQAEVEYDDKTGVITITKNANCKTQDANQMNVWTYIEYDGVKYENAVAVAKFQKDSTKVTTELYQNGKLIHSTVSEMDVPAKIIYGRTFVPARYVAYSLGYGIFFDPERNRVVYHYKANQVPDYTRVKEYPHDFYTYNSLFMGSMESVYNYRALPYRDSYGNIKVLDGDNGWDYYLDRENNIRGGEMSYMLYMPINYTFETKEHIITNSQSGKENLENYAKMYTDKMSDKSYFYETDYGYRADIDGNTYDKACSVKYYTKTGEYVIGPDTGPPPISDPSLAASSDYTRYDYTMFYYIDEDGYKIYWNGWTGSTVGHYMSKYNLLTLETFLGEMGERIWTMMDDYYMHTGPFDRGEVCVGTDFHQARKEFLEIELGAEHCALYGFEFVSSVFPFEGTLTDTGFIRTLNAKYNGIEFSIEYDRDTLMWPQISYTVTVKELPK